MLEGVRIDLFDAQGNLIKTTYTDANGEYKFDGLMPGTYKVFEHQPDGWLDSEEEVGTAGGKLSANDTISEIKLAAGVNGEHYDFCEIPPGSISGRVHADPEDDCEIGPNDVMLEGVRIDLFDAQNHLIATTYTDANGEYKFSNLAQGTYRVFEHQPVGYIDSEEEAGSVGGVVLGDDSIRSINLPIGIDATEYNFCEVYPVKISGHVYHDRDNDGNREAGEEAIAGVTVILLDFNNQEVARTKTNSAGFYEFKDLAPGVYSLVELQPVGWLDGKDTPGNRGGAAVNPGDRINGAVLVAGLDGVNYDFGELKPGSIMGRVHADTDGDCEYDPGEVLLEGVVINLLDAQGNIIQTTKTDAQGFYKFDNLPPGTYGVQEIQPTGYFQDDFHIGSGDGVKSKQDNMIDIHIGSDVDLVDYDFCEVPPAQISGYVFKDGATIVNPKGEIPSNVYDIRTGTRTSDDTPLKGVVLELRNGVTGEPIDASAALPGTYKSGPIRVTTDANGYYQFTGLPSGNYAVFQVQPDGYVDNLDTPGTLGGLAVNANNPINPLVLNQLGVHNPNNDAILRIAVAPGQHARENNFSEILVRPEVPRLPPPPPEPPTPPTLGGPRLDPNPKSLPLLPPPPVLPELYSGSAMEGYTWHLSVVDAGQPRSIQTVENLTHLTSAQFDAMAWQGYDLTQSGFTLYEASPGANRELVFGNADGIPVSGDFNGDGVDEIGVYIRGDWFIDLNANGIWDEGDLWARLGNEEDRPVTGDWDDDGKDDIGIFGPEWAGDPKAVKLEPGLPDPDNVPTGRKKNVPPTVAEATIGNRTMKLTSTGRLRTDLIDHVFYYGSAQDVPITGDWNGDGIKTIGLFRQGEWILDTDGNGRLTKADLHVHYGQPGDRPVVGDWNGDGVDEIGVYRGGTWTIDSNGNHTMDAVDKVFENGGADDLPLVGDWDGDGIDQAGVYHPRVEKTARAGQ
jgi:serine-aspartate repeat-containing protein C/D/E